LADKQINLTLKVVPSKGSRENLQALADRSAKADIGFVQGGVTNGIDIGKLVSLGSVAYEPLLIFYRSTNTVELLSEFKARPSRLRGRQRNAFPGVDPAGHE